MNKTESANHTFGKFPSLGDFLESYREAEQAQRAKSLEGLSPAAAQAALTDRNIAEVNAKLTVIEPDDTDKKGGKHQRFVIHVTKIIKSDPHIASDLNNALTKAHDVFVAVRFGDSMGLTKPVPGLTVGEIMHLKGEWIPAAKAHDHGGKKMSVLHFTHHPVGFICNPSKCYS